MYRSASKTLPGCCNFAAAFYGFALAVWRKSMLLP